ncbi:MAG: oligosaccharide flippase family protein [Phycisphaerales bacterium]|nr:oligosaccharide flippase family protein [Phycisphaerales bacterium]
MTDDRPDRTETRRTLRDLVLVAGGKMLSMGALFACAVIAARVGGGEEATEFGLYSTAIATILILDAIIGSPLDYSAVRFGALHHDEPARVDRFQAATFRLKLIIAAIFLAACAAAGPWIARRLFEGESRTTLLYLTLASTFALLLVRGTSANLQIRSRFIVYSLFDTGIAAVRLALLAAAAILGAHTAEPLVGVFGASALAMFVIFLGVRQPYLRAKWPDRHDARAILRFITATAGVIVLGTITGKADIPILSALTSAHIAGIYAAAAQVAMLATMLAGYACIVFQPRLIPMARQGKLTRLIGANILAGLAIGVLAAPLVIWALPPAMVAVFGQTYADSVPILRILLIGTWLDILFMPVLMTFAMQTRPVACLAGEVVITAAFFAVMPIVSRVNEIDAAITLAWIMTAVRVAKMVLYSAVTTVAMRGPLPEPCVAETEAPAEVT